MDKADPNPIEAKGTTGASGDLVTADGGKTWTADRFSIEASSFS